MRNVTVSIPDEVFHRARIRAAENNTSVSAMVAAYLRSISEDSDAEFTRLRNLQRTVSRRIRDFRAADRLTRDEAHDRAALR